MTHRRHFLSWERPLLPQAVEWLAGEWSGEGPLDLGSTLAVVPTRQSGRRLREALAAHAASRSQAVFAPRVVTPDGLIVPRLGMPVASRLISSLGWVRLLRGLDLDQFRSVFPVDPPSRSFSWALALARQLEQLQRTLGENGLSLGDVVENAGAEFAETERWRQLGSLGERHAASLAEMGLRESNSARIESASVATPPAGVERIVVIGVPDPFALALRALETLARSVPVEIAIFAAPGEQASFDDWGRPLAAAWGERRLPIRDFVRRVHLCADPEAEAGLASGVARSAAAGAIALGVADPEIVGPLESALRSAGVETFDPEGRYRRGDRVHQLTTALAAVAFDDSFAAAATLARSPDFLQHLGSQLGAGFSALGFLKSLDKVHADHLPPTLAEARRHLPDEPGLAALAGIAETLRAGAFPDGAAQALRSIFEDREFELARAEEARAAEALGAWAEVTAEVAAAAEIFGPLAPAECWELARSLYAAGRQFEERSAGAIDLQGWLELLWEDAPHLVVAGLNEGLVPESVVGDPFLPESLRVRLGLKNNPERFSRDAYVLAALAACRASSGQLDLLYGKVSSAGDPLRPSRLLLQCADEELPERVKFLFREAPEAGARPAWQRAWRLAPPRAAPPARIAATALNRWLQCPFRFYLEQVLRLAPVDPAKVELDARDFGTLCHVALEAMGREPALRDATDERPIREFLMAHLDAHVARRYGRELTVPLVVQVESARQRLRRAAAVQARSRADGWVIESVEHRFELPVKGVTIVGKIDRIDVNERSGSVRLLDYKTSDRPEDPAAAAVRLVPRVEIARAFARFRVGGREFAWENLQLPIYLRALGGRRAGCGYFNLPKAASETGIAIWESFSADVEAAAWRCAEGVVEAMLAGDFWPPSEGIRPDNDDFAGYFHGGAAASIDWRPEAGGQNHDHDHDHDS